MALIVVVDDSVTNRKLLGRLSKSIAEDTLVTPFASPAEALLWMRDHVPDLVITDYKMPGMDGAEFIQALRCLPSGRDVPVVVITAYEDREFRLRALDAGATDFLQTPIDHQEFLTRSRNLLRLGQQQRQIRGRAEDLEHELEASERMHAIAIRESRTRLIQVIDTIPAVISATDDTGTRVFVNRYGADLLPSPPPGRTIPLDLNDQRVLRSGQPVHAYEETVTDPLGQQRTLMTSKFPLLDDQGLVRTVLTTSFDISARKQAERALDHLAHHDSLTGLANRRHLLTMLQQKVTGLPADRPGFALHLIDLDRFKSINDGFGHDLGDQLLQAVANKLRLSVGANDLVARLGGDEFAIIQDAAGNLDQAHAFAERIIASVAEPVMLGQHQMIIGASIGITVAPDDGLSAEQLIKNADLAMYCAKRDGRGRARFFTDDMQATAKAAVLLEIALRHAIDQGEFTMTYQPQVDVAAGRVVGAEGLVRWRRPGHGVLTPGAFLPLAEDTGLIVGIDRWVLREVCRQGAAWAAAGTPIRVAANVSSRTFNLEDVRQLVMRALDETGLDPQLLEIELTESTLMNHHRDIQSELRALRQLGVRIAIDDFGTGYSSLAYLQLLPVDRLKIDGSFVRSLGRSAGAAAIVAAVVSMGKGLGMEVLTEGVETLEELQQVRRAGCDLVQGYHFSASLAPDSFHAYRPNAPAPSTRQYG